MPITPKYTQQKYYKNIMKPLYTEAMTDKETVFIDLSKCSEEQQKHIISLLPEKEFDNQYDIDSCSYNLSFDENDQWWVFNDFDTKHKTELTYPEFIKLFEVSTKLPSELLKEYFKNTPREQVLKDWESTAYLDNTNSPKIRELFEGGDGESQVSFSMDEMIAFGKKCFYKGFDKCATDDANCYTAWREESGLLIEQIKY